MIKTQRKETVTPAELAPAGARGSSQNPERMKLREKAAAINAVKRTPAPRVDTGPSDFTKKQASKAASREQASR
jgi:hypothetical protein